MSSVQEINREVRRYINGDVKLYELEDHLAPVLWDLERHSDNVLTDLVGRIHILLAEYSRGDRPEPSLRDKLAQLASPFVQSGPFAA